MFQFTTAVRIGRGADADSPVDPYGLTVGTVEAIAGTIRGLFETEGSEARALTRSPDGVPGWVADPPAHTWLGTRSRPVAVRL
jgi:hypothetical protein